ncbi:MAG TPA: DUF418 domain-containing protein [Vicinamibacterales bacterium]|nr:DUF418 domain-containing protein [Vicinamibacterales bacterium]
MLPADGRRLHVLDVLRGIALLGMFLVHFNNYSTGGGRPDQIYQKIVQLFFDERFWTMFGILFGVGFAIQFRRADARGEPYLAKYYRRMAMLAVFGFIAQGIFGYNVLLGYAIWGTVLPAFRKWSVPALVVALLLSAMSGNLYLMARAANGVATLGEQGFKAEAARIATENRKYLTANNAAQDSTSFREVVAARLQKVPWFQTQWYSLLPVNTLTLFLIGVLGLRLGLFDDPGRHTRLIVGLMVFGLASWAFETWVPDRAHVEGAPFLREMLLQRLAWGFGLVRGMWLAFTYIGAVLLLVARNPVWLKRLAVFGWPGRTALTSYMSQIIILDLTFSNYALGLSVTPLVGAGAAVVLFLVNVAFSRWWLQRHSYGPLEWLWRSATYARWAES